MFKIHWKAAAAWLAIIASIIITVVIILKFETKANEVPIAIVKDVAPKWEFQSTKDELTDEIYTNMHLYGESGLALFSVRCERMIDINGVNVPIYTVQIATSDYLGKTEWLGTRSVAYRLGAEHVVYESWAYSDRNAEQVFPLLLPLEERAAEILKRIIVVKEFIAEKTFKVRVTTYRYEKRDYTFEGRDPTEANTKLLAECVNRKPQQ